PYRNIDLRSQVTGLLEAAYFDEGQDVEEGMLLFKIQQAPFKADVDKAEADVKSSEAKVVQARALYARAISLLPSKAGTQEDVDVKKGDLGVAEANVKQAEAILRQTKVTFGYTEIRAPLSGRVGKRQVDPGNIVKANETVLTNLVALEPMYATF